MSFKKNILMVMIAATILTGHTVARAEEPEKPTAGLDMGMFSQYIWRGMALSKDSVVIQPSMTVGYKDFSFNIWGNYDSDSKVYNGAKYNETDLTLAYTKTVGIAKLTGGYIYYGLAETPTAKDTQEVFGAVGLTTILNPTITVYRDIASAPGWYVNLGVSHSQELVNKITLDLGASAGYYYSDSNSLTEIKHPRDKYRELHNGLVSAGFTIPFGDYFSAKPTIAYSFPLSSGAEDCIKANSSGGDSSFVFGGVTMSMAF